VVDDKDSEWVAYTPQVSVRVTAIDASGLESMPAASQLSLGDDPSLTTLLPFGERNAWEVPNKLELLDSASDPASIEV
jgi:hypothetical protein